MVPSSPASASSPRSADVEETGWTVLTAKRVRKGKGRAMKAARLGDGSRLQPSSPSSSPYTSPRNRGAHAVPRPSTPSPLREGGHAPLVALPVPIESRRQYGAQPMLPVEWRARPVSRMRSRVFRAGQGVTLPSNALLCPGWWIIVRRCQRCSTMFDIRSQCATEGNWLALHGCSRASVLESVSITTAARSVTTQCTTLSTPIYWRGLARNRCRRHVLPALP